MAEGRSRQLWEIGSNIMAVIVNSNKWGGQPVHPDKFNPHAKRVQALAPVSKEEKRLGFDMLRATFCPVQQGNETPARRERR